MGLYKHVSVLVPKSRLRLTSTLGLSSSSGSHLMLNGFAAGSFSNALVAFTDGLVVKLEKYSENLDFYRLDSNC